MQLLSLAFTEQVQHGNASWQTGVFTVQDQSSRSNLLSYLADHRYENFYFFGHGNNSAIGSYNGFILTQDQIAFALINTPLSYNYVGVLPFPAPYPACKIPEPSTIQHRASHPYRFVYSDACDAGAGNFCEAFGIPAQTCVNNARNDVHYTGANMDSSAVVYGAADMFSTTITRPGS